MQELFSKLPYLQKRHNKYGIRIRVPEEIRHIIGKSEVTRSLGTGDPELVEEIYYKVVGQVKDGFALAKKQLEKIEVKALTKQMAWQFAEQYYQVKFLEAEARAQEFLHNPEKNDQDLLEDILLDLRDAYAKGDKYTEPMADSILLLNGFVEIDVKNFRQRQNVRQVKSVNVDKNSEGYGHLRLLTHRGETETWERMKAILVGESFDQTKSAFPRNSNNVLQSIDRNFSTHRNDGKLSISLGDVIEQFFAADQSRSVRTVLDLRAAFRPLVELFGIKADANKLTKKDFRSVRDLIVRLPPNAGKGNARKNMSLVEIADEAKRNDEEVLHSKTVNKYLARISALMEWARKEPLIESNHAAELRVSASSNMSSKDAREPFSIGVLNQIFAEIVYSRPIRKNPSEYWVPLIALFQGMRMEEILQLTSADMQKENGILFFRIHAEGDNHLKNANACRNVPVHPKLLEWNFQSLIDFAGKGSNNRLFPDAKCGSEGKFSSIFSQRYSRYLRKIKSKTHKTSFHSFRHNFRDAGLNCQIPDDRIRSLAGWEIGSGTQANYGSGISLAEKVKAIRMLEYREVDFSKIVSIYWGAK